MLKDEGDMVVDQRLLSGIEVTTLMIVMLAETKNYTRPSMLVEEIEHTIIHKIMLSQVFQGRMSLRQPLKMILTLLDQSESKIAEIIQRP
jgi:hypothetical protein